MSVARVPRYCAGCGAGLTVDDQYCRACGAAVSLPPVSGIWREFALSFLAAATVLSAAVVGAVYIGDSGGTDGVNKFVSALSGDYSEYLAGIVPERFGFAFTAGLVTSFAPCGLFLLFAYPAIYLGTGEYEVEASLIERLRRVLGRALVVGGAIIAGLAVFLGIAGAISQTGGRSLLGDTLPWLALAIGVLLTLAAGWLLARSSLHTALSGRTVSRMGNPIQNNIIGYLLFGWAYAALTLSCTIPIFLVVIGSPTSFDQLVLYTMGMATFIILATLETALLIVGLTLAVALLKRRNALPRMNTVRTVLMAVEETRGILLVSLAGGYIVFFWLTVGRDSIL